MKNFTECMTPEAREIFKNWYVWGEETLLKLVDIESDQLTAENLRIIFAKSEDGMAIATVEDIEFYDPEDGDFDFKIGDDGSYIDREEAPKEVVEFLDNYLNKAQYENKK